eukprot:526467_1
MGSLTKFRNVCAKHGLYRLEFIQLNNRSWNYGSKHQFASNTNRLDQLKKDWKNVKSSLEKKYASWGGFDFTEFMEPLKRKNDRAQRYNPFFWYYYEQCQKKHAFYIAQELGLSINDIHFDKNKAYINSNLPIPQQKINELANRVKKECPMAKFNDILGNDDTEWIQQKEK